jgi:hypothetical protein
LTEIRILDRLDAEQFQRERLRSLRENPEAFGPTAEEESLMTLQQVEQMLAPAPEHFTVGAFDADAAP